MFPFSDAYVTLICDIYVGEKVCSIPPKRYVQGKIWNSCGIGYVALFKVIDEEGNTEL